MNIDLEISSPFMNAAGALGFTPPARWNWPEPPGAFVTNPLSLAARTPAETRALLPYPGGYLEYVAASGHEAPGMRA